MGSGAVVTSNSLASAAMRRQVGVDHMAFEERRMAVKIKVGIIGTGFVGPAHIEAVERTGCAEVVAVAGSNVEAAQRTARQYGIARAYGDYREMLQDPEIQCIHNCTPNHLHFSINRDIILAGKHVLSEKPLGTSRAETEELVRIAEEAGVVNGVCFNYRHYAMVQHLRAMIADGRLGTIRLIRGHYLQDWLSKDSDYNWRVHPQLGGRSRAVADIGSHWMDTVQFVTGQRITEVFADLATLLPTRRRAKQRAATFAETSAPDFEEVEVHTEDYATLLLRFDGGAVGTVTVSQITPGRKNHLVCEIDGSDASAMWDQEASERLWIGHRDGPNEIVMADPALIAASARPFLHYPGGHNQGWPDGLKNLMLRFYEAVREGAASTDTQSCGFATFAEGHRMQCVIDAMLESHARRQWVSVAYDA